MPIPEEANQRWSIDFVSDQMATGRRFRVLNVVDDYSRGMHRADRRHLDHRGTRQSTPGSSHAGSLPAGSDRHRQRPEFTSKAMHLWSQRTGVTLRFIQPGKPIQNALVESFNGKFLDACLNEHWFSGSRRCPAHHRGMARPLQHGPPAQFARISQSRTVSDGG